MNTHAIKALIIVTICTLCTANAFAQSDCVKMMTSAEKDQRNRNYQDAILKYIAAKSCDPKLGGTADAAIMVIFDTIQHAMKIAQQAKEKIIKQQQELDKKNERIMQQEEVVRHQRNAALAQSYWLFIQDPELVKYFNVFNIDFESTVSKLVDVTLSKGESFGAIYRTYFSSAFYAKYYDSLLQIQYLKMDNQGLNNIFATINHPNAASTSNEDQDDYTNGIKALGFSTTDAVQHLVWGKSKSSWEYFKKECIGLPFYNFVSSVYDTVFRHQDALSDDFLMPDGLIELPAGVLYAKPSSDKNYFNVQTLDNGSSQLPLRINYKSIALTDFKTCMDTRDTSTNIPDSGIISEVLQSYGCFNLFSSAESKYKLNKYKNSIEKGSSKVIAHSLKRNKGTHFDLARSPSDISRDGNCIGIFLDDNAGIDLMDTKTGKRRTLTRSLHSNDFSFSYHNTICYLGNENSDIIEAKLDGSILSLHNPLPARFNNGKVENINFANDRYLLLSCHDSIGIYDYQNKQFVKSFPSNIVSNIAVNPSGNIFVVTYVLFHVTDNKKYNDYLTVLLDTNFTVVNKLYAHCSNFFFTPNGKYIIGYNENLLMYWDVDAIEKGETKPYHTCFSKAELIKKEGILLNDFDNEKDPEILDRGARFFQEYAAKQTDTTLRSEYYTEAQALFGKLLWGDVKYVHPEKKPFYYDWYNWIDNKLGRRNFDLQRRREDTAIAIFEGYVHSKDSIYPMQVFYTANAYRISRRVNDSLKEYDITYIDRLKREIELRKKFISMVPQGGDNENLDDNNYYLSNTYGSFYLVNNYYFGLKDYEKKLQCNQEIVSYLISELKQEHSNYTDTIKYELLNETRLLASSYLYVFLNRSTRDVSLLDSSCRYVQASYEYTTNQNDSINLDLVKAEIFLLRDTGYSRAIAIIDQISDRYCTHNVGSKTEKDHILVLLNLLKSNGATNVKNLNDAILYLNSKRENLLKQPNDRQNEPH